QRQADGASEVAVGLLEDRAGGGRDPGADERAVGGVAVDEGVEGARREGQRWRADRKVARHERGEAEGGPGHESERGAPQDPGLRAESLHDPQPDQGTEEEGRLAGEQGEREECARDEPAAHARVASGEPPEQEERGGDAERVAHEKGLVQQERSVERRPEGGAFENAPRPGPAERHVGFLPRALVLGDRQTGHETEVRDPHGGGEAEDGEEGAAHDAYAPAPPARRMTPTASAPAVTSAHAHAKTSPKRV